MADSSLLNDVFELLEIATQLEETGNSRIEAATKYYEAVYLLRRYLSRLPRISRDDQRHHLLQEKCRHYESLASQLMADDDSSRAVGEVPTSSPLHSHPLSPIDKEICSNEDSSIVPVKCPSAIISKSQPRSEVYSKTSQANTKLAHALDLDESCESDKAIESYLKAAELYLQALQLEEQDQQSTVQSVSGVLKRRLEQTLDRVEQLKHPSTQSPLNPCNDQRIGTNQQNSSYPTSQQKGRNSSHLSNTNDKPKVEGSLSSSSLTADEISILKRSSLIASGVFMPWSDEDSAALAVEATNPKSTFTDPDGFLRLSDKQKERFHRWARPSEIVQMRQESRLIKKSQQVVVVKAISPYSIKQQYVTDCSFIASLCICAAFERRFQKRLVTSILHPQGTAGELLYNRGGKYMVKLWLNGVARAVVIDDYLPVDKYGNLLCSSTTSSSGTSFELWVCLIEKAYMKLCGGYDFPGSNSGVDLFSLTGFIPERLLFAKDSDNVRDFEIAPERAWERIASASSFGDCLITVSTHLEISTEEADKIGLVTGHAYAVLAVLQTKDGTRLLQLKNPWAHKGWKGRYSCYDEKGWREPSFRTEVGYDPQLAARRDDGVFWICWDDILLYFRNFHLSWNPALFKCCLTTHGFWPKNQGPFDDTFNVGENPQFVLTFSKQAIKKKASVWILVSRHITKQEQDGQEATDFLTIHVHRNNGKKERIWYPGKQGNCILTGAYTNNPQVLVRYDLMGTEDEHLSLVLSQHKKSNSLGYTLSSYCTEDFSISKPEKDLPHNDDFSSSWTQSTAGGPIGRDAFLSNPTYTVLVPDGGATVQFRLSTRKTVAANVVLVPVSSHGQPAEKAVGEPVINSGKYRHGFLATKRYEVKAGPYALVVSNFHQGQKAPFQLKVLSSKTLKIQQIK